MDQPASFPARGRPPKHDYAKMVAAIRQIASTRETALPLMAMHRGIVPIYGPVVSSTLASILRNLKFEGQVQSAPGDYGLVYWVPAEPAKDVEV